MIFHETLIPGAFAVALEPVSDDRGWFARTFCADEFAAHGLNPLVLQCNTSFNPVRATLRGLHFQRPPHAECKLVRCTRGRVYDVVVDLRPDSPAYRRWHGTTLAAGVDVMAYIPEGCAHGFITLEDDTEVQYQMSHAHVPASAAGVRWDDPAFAVDWPLAPAVMSERDLSYPAFQP